MNKVLTPRPGRRTSMSSRAEMKTFSCIFPESVLYYKSTCRCDGMVDVVDSKCVASDFPSSGNGVANSLLFWYSGSSFINIPPVYPSCFFGSVRSRVFIKVCRCVGTGRRGGLKILWANPPCGFDSRHRHHICSEVSCFGAFFTAQKQNIEHFSETPEELHLQTRPYWKNPNVCNTISWLKSKILIRK